MTRLPDVPPIQDQALYTFLQSVRQRLYEAVTTTTSSSGATTVAEARRDPLNLVLDFGAVGDGASNNDAQFGLAEASTVSSIRVPDGVFVTTLAKSAFTKRYEGDGLILAGAAALPANFSYLRTKPDTWPVQGEAGWFRGGQGFTDGGEWKIIGPSVRTYDTAARYFESTCIPHHAWFDIESGSSGAQAYMTSGAAAGASTVTINGPASAEWVGKQVNLCNSFGGATVETKTVQSVAGSSVTFTTPLTSTYTWNPAAGLHPCLQFAPRTWNGYEYIRVRHRGGGDGYGHIVRMQVEYQPKPSELIHTFNACTGGQYGGSVDFTAGTTGTYATGWESQYNAIGSAADPNGPDVAVIGQVDSFNRSNDRAAGGGRMWLGQYLKSEGLRPADVTYAIGGRWRVGLDTSQALLMDSSYLLDAALAGAQFVNLKSTNGALVGDPITLTAGNVVTGFTVYSGNIVSITGTVVQVSPPLTATMPAGTYADFTRGGAIINAALRQKIVWNSTASAAERAADLSGVHPPAYGNVQGDIETGTESDGAGDFWYTRFNGRGHGGATARIRLRPTVFQVNVDVQVGATVSAARELVTNALTGSGDMSGCIVFGAGLGHQLRFNLTLNRFEFVRNGSVISTVP